MNAFPREPGVYLMKDAKGQVHLRRQSQAPQKPDEAILCLLEATAARMIPFLIQEIAHIDTIVVDLEKEALLLENTLIKKHQPKFNAFLKDDKTFISLMINHQHKWPMYPADPLQRQTQDQRPLFWPLYQLPMPPGKPTNCSPDSFPCANAATRN